MPLLLPSQFRILKVFLGLVYSIYFHLSFVMGIAGSPRYLEYSHHGY